MTLLRRSVGEKAAFDLAATGRLVGAGEAQTLGLVSRVFPDDEFESSAPTVLAELAGRSATALALTKQQFYQLDGLSFEAGIHLGADVNAISRTTPDFKEAIAAFLSK
jgi:methylglutaconyl-CoA hydratase